MLDPDRISAAVMATQQTTEFGILSLCILLVGTCLVPLRARAGSLRKTGIHFFASRSGVWHDEIH